MRTTKKFKSHLVATVEDLTDMLDCDSEDIDGMDDDAGDDQELAPTGHWKATSSYDIYMVDIPKDGNGEETAEDDPSKKQPKRRRQRRRSKSRHSKNEDSDKMQRRRTETPALMRERQKKR